jgi:hypothetical protein
LKKLEHPVFGTTLVRAKHSDYQLLVLTERLFARMLRPYIIGMLTKGLTAVFFNPKSRNPKSKIGITTFYAVPG